jgi:hypothetical protein
VCLWSANCTAGVALNDGALKSNGSNSRLLNQLVTVQPTLDLTLPSISEALAVMAGCTLIQSTKDTPFVEFWVSQHRSSLADASNTLVTELLCSKHCPRSIPILQCLDPSPTIRFGRHSTLPTRLQRRPLRGLHPKPSCTPLLSHASRLVYRHQ